MRLALLILCVYFTTAREAVEDDATVEINADGSVKDVSGDEERRSVWPEGFIYSHSYIQTSTPQEQLKEVVRVFDAQKDVQARYITDEDHPAYKDGDGIGLFATKDLPAGSLLGSYSGVMSPYSDEKDNTYTMTIGEDFLIDASEYGNEFRFINDAYKTGRSENVEFNLENSPRGQWVAVWLCSDVKAGDELLVNYGVDYRKTFFGASDSDAAEGECPSYRKLTHV